MNLYKKYRGLYPKTVNKTLKNISSPIKINQNHQKTPILPIQMLIFLTLV